MTSDQVQGWLQILGMVGVIASLIFVGAQFNQVEKIADFEGAGNAESRDVEYFAFLAENSSVMRRGCVGEELSPDDESKFSKLFRAWTLRSYWKYHQDSLRELGVGAQEGVNRFAAHLHRYPGLQRMHDKYLNWRINVGVTSEDLSVWTIAIVKRLEELETIEPNPEYDGTFCGS